MNSISRKFFIAVVAVLQACFILYYHRTGIYADQWDLVPILQPYLAGEEWFHLTLQLHGGHYHTAAYLIMLPVAKWTGWNLLAEALIITVLNLLSFRLLYCRYLEPIIKRLEATSLLVTVAFTGLFFSVMHGGNALWTWQTAVYLTTFGLALTLYGLTKDRFSIYSFSLSIGGALVASYSFSCGFAIWPIGFLIIAQTHVLSKKARINYLIIWSTTAAVVLHGFLAQFSITESVDLEVHFFDYVSFLFYYLGTPIAYFSRDLSLIVAIIGFLGGCYLAIKLYIQSSGSQRTKIVCIISLMAFALICGALIAAGRIQFGLDQARSFRYIIFSQFFWLGLLMLIWENFDLSINKNAQKNKQVLMNWLLGLLILFIAFNSQKIGRSSAKTAQEYDALYQELSTSQIEPVQRVQQYSGYPEIEVLKSHIEVLKKWDLSYFRQN